MQQNKKNPKKSSTQKQGKGAVGKVGKSAPKGGHSMKPLLHAPIKSRSHVNGTKSVNVLPTDQNFGSFH